MKVTRADVAKLAGVSTATVSYVLNGSRKMSDRTRQVVMEAVKQLNYKPDMIARSMTKNETMQMSLLINDITNPFYSEIIVGFEAAAMEKGYFVNVCNGDRQINDYFDNYIARRIDGVFVAAIPQKFDLDKLYELTEHGVKVVVSGNIGVDLKRVSSIENDYLAGMQTAVAHLHGLGHTRIAYLSGLSRRQTFDCKVAGYLAAMERHGLSCAEELLLEGKAPYGTGVADGYAMANELMASKKPFTAAICTNDLMAIGAICAFEDAGLRVPQDISVMGFDDILFARTWRPALTTMAVSKFEFGGRAFELLYTNIKKGSTGYYLSQLTLKARASTAKRAGLG